MESFGSAAGRLGLAFSGDLAAGLRGLFFFIGVLSVSGIRKLQSIFSVTLRHVTSRLPDGRTDPPV
jgi:hypothetical protein